MFKKKVLHLVCECARHRGLIFKGCQFICSGYLSRFSPQHSDTFVQSVTHRCRVWISTDICVWWEALGLTGPTEATPSTHMFSNITSGFPAGFRPVFVQVRALSQPCSGRQVFIEGSTKAVKWGKMREQIMLAYFSLYQCWGNGGVINYSVF